MFPIPMLSYNKKSGPEKMALPTVYFPSFISLCLTLGIFFWPGFQFTNSPFISVYTAFLAMHYILSNSVFFFFLFKSNLQLILYHYHFSLNIFFYFFEYINHDHFSILKALFCWFPVWLVLISIVSPGLSLSWFKFIWLLHISAFYCWVTDIKITSDLGQYCHLSWMIYNCFW